MHIIGGSRDKARLNEGQGDAGSASRRQVTRSRGAVTCALAVMLVMILVSHTNDTNVGMVNFALGCRGGFK